MLLLIPWSSRRTVFILHTAAELTRFSLLLTASCQELAIYKSFVSMTCRDMAVSGSLLVLFLLQEILDLHGLLVMDYLMDVGGTIY